VSNIQDNFQDNSPQAAQPAKPKVDLLDYLLTAIFALWFIAILFYFEVVQRIALAKGRLQHNKAVARLNRALVDTLKVVGAKIEVTGEVKMEPSRLYIVVSNHQSLFDVCSLHTLFAERFPRFVSKKELAGYLPSVSYNLNHGLNAVIDRSDRQQAIAEIEKLGQNMKEHGFVSILFPEGTRSRTGQMRRFHTAGLLKLLEVVPAANIIPVTIDESWKIQSHRKGPIPRNVKIHIHVGEVLNRSDFLSDKEIFQQSEKVINETLEKIRSHPNSFGEAVRLV